MGWGGGWWRTSKTRDGSGVAVMDELIKKAETLAVRALPEGLGLLKMVWTLSQGPQPVFSIVMVTMVLSIPF